MNRAFYPVFLFLLLLFSESFPARRRAPGNDVSEPVIIRHADYFEQSLENGRVVRLLAGNVSIYHDGTDIKSDTARYYKERGIINLSGNVSILREGRLLLSDKGFYRRSDRYAKAEGKVKVIDEGRQVRIEGEAAELFRNRGEVVIKPEPVLFKADSSGKDTLKIYSEEMSYFRKNGAAKAIRNVRIYKGEIESQCDTAWFRPDSGFILLLEDPVVNRGENSLKGDTIKMFLDDQKLNKMYVLGSAEGVFPETDTVVEAGSKDSVRTKYSEMYADSIFIYFSDSRLSRVETYSNSIGYHYFDDRPEEKNRINGYRMDMYFDSSGTVKKMHVEGNAENLYYYTDEGPGKTGINKCSGEVINIYFLDGRINKVNVKGGTRGAYYPLNS
ncbi:MAG: OstA-like protein [Fibrobacterota bacterium]